MKKFWVLASLVCFAFSFGQSAKELQEIRDQLKIQFWKLKEQNLKARERIRNELTLLGESIETASERRNSLVEEFYLIQENFNEVEENLQESENERNAFVDELQAIVLREKDQLKSSFPIFVERNTPILNAMEQNKTQPLALVRDILEYKRGLLAASESLEVYQRSFLNPETQELTPVNVLRVGFVGSIFTDNEDFTGFLIRQAGLGGIGYEWVSQLSSSDKADFARSVNLVVNRQVESGQDEGGLLEIAVDPVQAGDKLKSFLSSDNRSLGQSFLEFVASGGVIMYPLLLLGIIALLIIIERLFFYNQYDFKKSKELFSFLNQFDEKSLHKNVDFDLKRQQPLWIFIQKLLKNPTKNQEDLTKAVEEQISDLETKLNSKLTTLGVLGTIAPLLGLLGTVSGMIALFDVITLYGTSNPKILAGGISIALVTTQTGLSLAIPILLFHHYLVRRKVKIVNFLEEKAIKISEFKRFS